MNKIKFKEQATKTNAINCVHFDYTNNLKNCCGRTGSTPCNLMQDKKCQFIELGVNYGR